MSAEGGGELLGIREAARRSGCSERALRYYQQVGLVTPAGRTPGGLRRYSADDLARVARIRELQSLLGLNLEEIGEVLGHEDRLAEIRCEFRAIPTEDPRRRELVGQAIEHYEGMRATVEAKLVGLAGCLDDLDTSLARARGLLEDPVSR